MVSCFRDKLIDWFRTPLNNEGMVNVENPNLITLDDPKKIPNTLLEHYEGRDLALSTEEQKILLEL